MAEAAKIPLDKLRQAREAVRTLSSLDRPVGEDESATLGDLIASPEGDPVAGSRRSRSATERSTNALDTLSPTQRRVLELRFGLSGDEPVSLQKVGEELGLTRERVRQLEQSALEQLSRNRELREQREAA